MQVYVWNVSSFFSLSEEDEIWKNSLALIDKERRTKLEKYRNPKDRARSLAAGLLLRYGFLQYIKEKESLYVRKEKLTGIAPEENFTENLSLENAPEENFTENLSLENAPEENFTENLSLENAPEENFTENLSLENAPEENPTKKPYTKCFIGENLLEEYDLSCGQGAHEKPYFLHYPEVQFNLSHSGDYIALVIGAEQCGIDIQEPRKLSDGFRRKFYHEQEKEWLENHPEDDIRIFSLKEALMKFTGEGLSKAMNDFSVIPLLLKQEVREMNQRIFGESICLANDYALSVVTTGEKDKKLLERVIYLEDFSER